MPKLPPRMRHSHGAYYHVSYTLVDGVRRQRWVRLAGDYGKAIRKYADVEAARERDRQDYRALWAAYRAQELPQKAATTQKNYLIWGDYLLDVFADVMPADIDEARRPVTAQRMVQLLSAVLAWGAKRDWLPSNPLTGFRKGPKARRGRYVTDRELAAIMAACPADLALVVRFMHYTALRRSDVFSLRWSQVKDDGIHVVMQKTKAAILLHWTPELRAMREEALRRPVVGLHVFADARGRKLSAEAAWKRFKIAAAKAGVPHITFHDLRRKRLTDLQVAGERELAQRLAGHRQCRACGRRRVVEYQDRQEALRAASRENAAP